MNGQEIIEMGYEARLCDEEGRDDASIIITDHMTRFAKLVAAKEREKWAKEFAGLGEWTCVHIIEAHE